MREIIESIRPPTPQQMANFFLAGGEAVDDADEALVIFFAVLHGGDHEGRDKPSRRRLMMSLREQDCASAARRRASAARGERLKEARMLRASGEDFRPAPGRAPPLFDGDLGESCIIQKI